MSIFLLTLSRIFETSYGEEKFTRSLGKWLALHGEFVILIGSELSKIKVVFLSKSNIADFEDSISKKVNMNVRMYSVPYMVYMIYKLFLACMTVLKLLYIFHKKKDVTLIHAQDTGYAGLAAVIVGKILKIPILLSSHSIRHHLLASNFHGGLNKALIKLEYKLDLFTIRNANRVIAVNQFMKAYYEQKTRREIDFIPIPIILKDYEFSEKGRTLVRMDLGIDDTAKVIGYVGRLSTEKNLPMLLRSFECAARMDLSLKLVLVGAGPDEASLKDYVSLRGISDKVLFCGVRNDINMILSSLDIFVLPSITEGMPNSLLEAMACGRAIIASDIPANRELLVDNQNAIFVDPARQEELYRAIVLLSNNEDMRIKLGNKARDRCRDYDQDYVFSKLLQYYRVAEHEHTGQI